MSIILARIDDRLIHGQITEGWGRVLKPELIGVVSDQVASSDWEIELCLAALPSYIQGMVINVDDAAQKINELNSNHRASYILFESPHDAHIAVKNGAQIATLNVGGMHSVKGKREILDYIFLDEDDIKHLKALQNAGIKLDFRDLPEHDNVDVMSTL